MKVLPALEVGRRSILHCPALIQKNKRIHAPVFRELHQGHNGYRDLSKNRLLDIFGNAAWITLKHGPQVLCEVSHDVSSGGVSLCDKIVINKIFKKMEMQVTRAFKDVIKEIIAAAFKIPYIELIAVKSFMTIYNLRNSSLVSFHKNLIKSLYSNRYHYSQELESDTITDSQGSYDYDLTLLDHKSERTRPSLFLMDLNSKLANAKLDFVQSIQKGESHLELQSIFPELSIHGQHYELLHLIPEITNAQYIVEIGTASGCSLVSFLTSANVKYIDTFDINPLETNAGWVSKETNIKIANYLQKNSNRWQQHVVNLTINEEFNRYSEILNRADIIFVDADHTGFTENKLFSLFSQLDIDSKKLFIWDDIYLSSMVSFWNNLQFDKIDVSPLGHYSGTGISRMMTK